jgi:hypothetical protein
LLSEGEQLEQEKDGYIVKVMGERKTIFGTA